MNCSIDWRAGLIDQEGITVGAPLLALFDPDCQFGVGPEGRVGRCGWTVREAVEAYCRAKKSVLGTRRAYQTLARRWEIWSSSLRSATPKAIGALTAEDWAAFLGWVQSEAESAGDGNVGRTFNKYRGEISAVLRWLVDEEQLSALPRLPAKQEQRTVAGAYYLERGELSRVYWQTYNLKNPRGWPHVATIGAMWRAALVMFYAYGLDTHALFYCRGKETLCWEHILDAPRAPGRVAKVRCKYGWIRWQRQKTGRLLLLPVHPIVRAHLESIRPSQWSPGDRVFGVAGRSKPNEVFRELISRAGLEDKLDAETGDTQPYVLKDLRKTCATAHGAVRGRLILGHADGTITEKHYANQLPEVLAAVRELRFFRAAKSILDDRIKPPADVLLFAK